jgi:hypothetical protein
MTGVDLQPFELTFEVPIEVPIVLLNPVFSILIFLTLIFPTLIFSTLIFSARHTCRA